MRVDATSYAHAAQEVLRWALTGESRYVCVAATVNNVIEAYDDPRFGAIMGKQGITLRHVDGPQGVRGRNSDNSRLRKVLGWEPGVDLEAGLLPTYRWIDKQVNG
jgi:nucleoside-diphosphate-sugar epimerase